MASTSNSVDSPKEINVTELRQSLQKKKDDLKQLLQSQIDSLASNSKKHIDSTFDKITTNCISTLERQEGSVLVARETVAQLIMENVDHRSVPPMQATLRIDLPVGPSSTAGTDPTGQQPPLSRRCEVPILMLASPSDRDAISSLDLPKDCQLVMNAIVPTPELHARSLLEDSVGVIVRFMKIPSGTEPSPSAQQPNGNSVEVNGNLVAPTANPPLSGGKRPRLDASTLPTHRILYQTAPSTRPMSGTSFPLQRGPRTLPISGGSFPLQSGPSTLPTHRILYQSSPSTLPISGTSFPLQIGTGWHQLLYSTSDIPTQLMSAPPSNSITNQATAQRGPIEVREQQQNQERQQQQQPTTSTNRNPQNIRPRVLCNYLGCREELDKADFVGHLRNKHGSSQYRCVVKDCNQSFEHIPALEQHLVTGHKELSVWHCAKCDKHYQSSLGLYLHHDETHNRTVYHCPYLGCTTKGASQADVSTHYSSVHKPMLTCPFQSCDLQFTNAVVLKEHKRTSHGQQT